MVNLAGESMEPKIVTFYSFKGGVGRTMALANVAWHLAEKHNKNVLIIDWDLEAPGLHFYFNIDKNHSNLGLIDLLYEYKDVLQKKQDIGGINIDKYITSFSDPDLKKGTISIVTSGRLDDGEYPRRVNDFNWDEFYGKWAGGKFIEYLKKYFRMKADFILVDSRTGISDISGICTMQLPDILVILFSLNEQNFYGVEMVVDRIISKSPAYRETSEPPQLILVPSPIEINLEQERKIDFEHEAAKRFDNYITKEAYKDDFLKHLKYMTIPYIGFLSFGEVKAVQKYPDEFYSLQYIKLSEEILRRFEKYDTDNIQAEIYSNPQLNKNEKNRPYNHTDLFSIDESILYELIENDIDRYLQRLKDEFSIIISCYDEGISLFAAYTIINRLPLVSSKKRIFKFKKNLPVNILFGKYWDSHSAIVVNAFEYKYFLRDFIKSGEIFYYQLKESLKKNDVSLVCIIDSISIKEVKHDIERKANFPLWNISFLQPLLKLHYPDKASEFEKKINNQKELGLWDMSDMNFYRTIRNYISTNTIKEEIEKRNQSLTKQFI